MSIRFKIGALRFFGSPPLLLCAGFLMSVSAREIRAESNRYMGAASCASSNCHGSVSPRNASSVLQNEYITWQKQDRHSRAYTVLLEEDARIIGKHLGIAQPEKEKWCLDCHATNAAPAQHGEKFRIDDGVGCESCHGAAEGWLSSHTSRGATHADNVSRGMTDIVNPSARAALCVTCHIGNDEKAVTHRLIGAGHPRLTFELDTFGMIQPRHWEVDDDYRKRKREYLPITSWLLGQNAVGIHTLDALGSEKRSTVGAWPELTLFYCYSCHHSLTEDQWKKRDYHGKPGELRLNLASLVLLEQALAPLDAAAAKRVGELRAAIEREYPLGRGGEAVAEAKQYLSGPLAQKLTSQQFTHAEGKASLRALLTFGSKNTGLQYEVAEQIAMGASSILSFLSPTGNPYQTEVNRMYQSLGQPEEFRSELFSESCATLLAAVK